jgi:hypothetical protein
VKIDYQPFVVDEISLDVVIVVVVATASSFSLGKSIAIGTTTAVIITILAMILKISHIVFLPTIVSLKNE